MAEYGYQRIHPAFVAFGRRSKISGHVRRESGSDQTTDHAGDDIGGTARTAICISFDDAPSIAIGEQRGQYRVIQLMAATNRTERPEQRQAGQRKVADDIKHLMAHSSA